MIEDSLNTTFSPTSNLFSFNCTNSIVDAVLLTTWATALLFCPTIFSPVIAFVSNANPVANVNLSKTGVDVSVDSYTARILTTSGTFKDISLSSTLNP